MIIQANKEGFTIWSKEGFIILDCPFERLNGDHTVCIGLLNSIHKSMMEQNEKKSCPSEDSEV